MIEMATLLEHLQDAGYDPQEPFGHDDDWYDLMASGIGTVRVCASREDTITVHFFDAHMNCEWTVTLSPGTPGPVVLAVLEAAEWQLAYRRGGPVTPAQAQVRR